MKPLPLTIFASLTILLSVTFASCHKDEDKKNTASAELVPNSPGCYWKYSIKSAAAENNGFLEVRIIKKATLTDGRPVTTWVYSYPQFTDTIYKVSNATSLEEYLVYPDKPGDSYPVMRYVFPLETGMKWAVNSTLATDSVKVVNDTTIGVAAGSFAHSIQLDIVGSHNIGNYLNNSQYWFTSNIGIVRLEYNVFNLGPDKRNGIYELVEYRLK